jgi:hypothetical protein
MFDIPSVSIVIASSGVFVAAIYYILQIRHQTRIRRTDLIVKLNPWFNISPKELEECENIIMALKYKDYDDFVQKYGSLFSGKPETNALRTMLSWADGIGILLKRNLVDIDIIIDSYGGNVQWSWEKLKPIVEGFRKEAHDPQYCEWFEYLYNEMEKREQRGG